MRLGILALVVALLSGCASVSSTSAYYVPATTRTFLAKAKDAEIPIVGKAPKQRHEVIGRLAFESDQGWKFLRASMVYNARVHGADLVVLKSAKSRSRVTCTDMPSQWDWYPVLNYSRNNDGQIYGSTVWVPQFRPGYVQRWVDEITAIDADMIVLKR